MASLCFGDLEQDSDTGSLGRKTKISFRYTPKLFCFEGKKKNRNNVYKLDQLTKRCQSVWSCLTNVTEWPSLKVVVILRVISKPVLNA